MVTSQTARSSGVVPAFVTARGTKRAAVRWRKRVTARQKRQFVLSPLVVLLSAVILAQPQPQGRKVALGDWPYARGPHRDGRSDETGLIEKWQLNGTGFLWRAPYGGRSAPVVMGNRVYVQNPAGLGENMQERVMALDADTGRLMWEYKFNVFQSDVPPHRVGWASPAADPRPATYTRSASARRSSR